jgi:hypothetical protein
MRRQYCILYKRHGSPDYTRLEPHTQAAIYDRPEVNHAVEIVRTTPYIKGVALIVGDEAFNVVELATQEAIAPRAFVFQEPAEAAALGTVLDASVVTTAGQA